MFLWRPFRRPLPSLGLARPEAYLERLLAARGPALPAGSSVAVAVGSRGLASYRPLVQTLLDHLRDQGCRPFLLPAMGSHGGSAAGQLRILAGYGLTARELGVEIRAGDGVVAIGQLPDGRPVYLAKSALKADAVWLFNRVKPHTVLDGPPASGLLKMLTIGLGQAAGAASLHAGDLAGGIREAAELIRSCLPRLWGLAMVEDGRHRPAILEVLASADFRAAEERLLPVAGYLRPTLPPVTIDLLLVDQMGKDMAGTGMDPGVVGLWRRRGGSHQGNVLKLAVLDLTAGTHGNASGVGMADFTTTRLLDRVDWNQTRKNARAAGFLAGAEPPPSYPNDRELLRVALAETGPAPRVVRIRSTLELGELWASEALWGELPPPWQAAGAPRPPEFDVAGNLRPFGRGI